MPKENALNSLSCSNPKCREKEKLIESMTEAGKEDLWLAGERGAYHEGVPAITVIFGRRVE